MNQDPLFQDILDALHRPLDPDTFEQCATSILRRDWPTIVPVRGGSDAGMDGAIADGLGEPLPLVCTTGTDAVGNLRKSLASYIARGESRRRAVFITPRELSPPRQRTLHDRALKLGFTLLQIYTQAAVAELLYHEPRWCRNLLGLTGQPPALSRFPVSRRALLGQTLVGRDDDMAWLTETKGDLVVSGSPGSGKTSLLHQFVSGGGGLFVVSEDPTAIANAIRNQQPASLIVDDAHARPDFLTELVHLRREIHGEYRIITATWTGARSTILEALSLGEQNCRELARLTRDEIVIVIHNLGIAGPDPLVREIVDQAEGQPGLAVTLGHLCLQGGVREVMLGNAISRTVLTGFERLVGGSAIGILAGFAIGGDEGVAVPVVARVLGVSRLELQRTANALAAGGVIREVECDVLAVYPRGLRDALVRDQFFTGPARLPLAEFLDEVRDQSSLIQTLISAQEIGAHPEPALLPSLIERSRNPSLWAHYATLGPREAAYVLVTHPEFAVSVARPALLHVPQEIIPLLLDATVGDERPTHQYPEHPLRLIEDWVKGAMPGTEATLSRRRTLAHAARGWLENGGESGTGWRAVAAALSPEHQRVSSGPGSGDVWNISRGVLTPDELSALQQIWSSIQPILPRAGRTGLRPILDAVDELVYLRRATTHPLDPEHDAAAGATALVILQDVLPFALTSPGLMRRCRRASEALDLSPQLPPTPEFDVLFPDRDETDWRAEQERTLVAVRQLADEWSRQEPTIVAHRIVHLEDEAAAAGIRGSRTTPRVCYELAFRVANPVDWAYALMASSAPWDGVQPFLRQSAVRRVDGFEKLLRTGLERDAYQSATFAVVLATDPPPASLLEAVLPLMAVMADTLKPLHWPRKIPSATMRRLLRHESDGLASAAAVSLWLDSDGHGIPSELEDQWQAAFLRTPPENEWVEPILQARPDLRSAWLSHRIRSSGRFRRLTAQSATVIADLDEPTRLQLIDSLPSDFSDYEALAVLIGGSPAAYKHLLARWELKHLHLIPIGLTVDSAKGELLTAALEAGYGRRELVGAVFPFCFGHTGKESAWWEERVKSLRSVALQPNSEVAAIIGDAIRSAEQDRDRAVAAERREAIYGW
jgi:hypothetical protein